MKFLRSTNLGLIAIFAASLAACPSETPAGQDASSRQDAASSADANIDDAGILDHLLIDDANSPDDSAVVNDANSETNDAAIDDATVDDDASTSDAVLDDAATEDAATDTDASLGDDAGSSLVVDATLLCKIHISGVLRVVNLVIDDPTSNCSPGATMNWDTMNDQESISDYVDTQCASGAPLYEIIASAFDAGHLVVSSNLENCLEAGTEYRNSHNTVEAYTQDPIEDITVVNENCIDLISGTVQENGICTLDWECANDLHCDYQDSDNSFRCLTPATLGNACTSQSDSQRRRCAQGLACVSNQCIQPASAGSDCINNAACQEGLYCKDSHCTAYASVGQSCTDTDCENNLYCRSSDHICREYEAMGASCIEQDNACAGHCVECRRTSATSTDYTCMNLATENEYCDHDSDCLTNLFCNADNNQCETKKAIGQACPQGTECQADLLCKDNICSAKNCQENGNCEAGESCTNDTNCADDLICHPTQNQCVNKPGLNQSCDVLTECDNETYCNDSDLCVAKKAAGENCNSNDECISAICNTDQNLCTPNSGGCLYDKANFGMFVFFGLAFAPLRRRWHKMRAHK